MPVSVDPAASLHQIGIRLEEGDSLVNLVHPSCVSESAVTVAPARPYLDSIRLSRL